MAIDHEKPIGLFGSQSTGSLLTLPDIRGTPSFMITGNATSKKNQIIRE